MHKQTLQGDAPLWLLQNKMQCHDNVPCTSSTAPPALGQIRGLQVQGIMARKIGNKDVTQCHIRFCKGKLCTDTMLLAGRQWTGHDGHISLHPACFALTQRVEHVAYLNGRRLSGHLCEANDVPRVEEGFGQEGDCGQARVFRRCFVEASSKSSHTGAPELSRHGKLSSACSLQAGT